MRFVHIADLHFDTPFTSLKSNEYMIEKRKLEQRDALKKVINYIKENNIDYLFIAGDLYENEYVKKSTIDYIDSLFKEIPNTKIFITPGNHDPNIKGGIYDTYEFSENVKVFKNNYIEKYEDENIELYGFGFKDFYMNKSEVENFKLIKNDKLQILMMHSDLNGIDDSNGYSYNPISELNLKSKDFDYIALGHIHKTNFNENNRIIYPGSLVSLGFDELGAHGMVVGDFHGKYIKLKFEKVDYREFVELDVDISNMSSQNDLIEELTNLYIEKNNFCKIILKGKRKFVINTKSIMYLIDNSNILKIKDETTLAYCLEELAKENTLKGIFIKKLLEKKEQGYYTEDEIEKAIEIGLEAME